MAVGARERDSDAESASNRAIHDYKKMMKTFFRNSKKKEIRSDDQIDMRKEGMSSSRSSLSICRNARARASSHIRPGYEMLIAGTTSVLPPSSQILRQAPSLSEFSLALNTKKKKKRRRSVRADLLHSIFLEAGAAAACRGPKKKNLPPISLVNFFFLFFCFVSFFLYCCWPELPLFYICIQEEEEIPKGGRGERSLLLPLFFLVLCVL